MKVLGPLSAATVALALSPSSTDAFAASTRYRKFPAFSSSPSSSSRVVSPPTTTSTKLHSATLGTSPSHHHPQSPAQSRAAAEAASQSRYRRSNHTPDEWSLMLQTDPLLSHIRSELISKYLTLGRTRSDAEVEVDAFLNDEERSGEFVEMRRYAWVQREEKLGFEDAVCRSVYGGRRC